MLLLYEEVIKSVSWEKEKPNVLNIFFTEKVDMEHFFFCALFELLGLPGQKTLHSGILQITLSSQKKPNEEIAAAKSSQPKSLALELPVPLEDDCHSIKFYSRTKRDMVIYTIFPIMKN